MIIIIIIITTAATTTITIKRKRKERQVLEPCQRTKKVVERVGDGDTNCNWSTWNDP